MKKLIPALFIFAIVVIFFWQFFAKGLLPIPSDTIIGLYHPFRDLYAKDYPNGIPFKNFLITDPVRQQYPWRELAISLEKKFQLPLWNPYNFSGTPLLANFQSAPFYPLNILLFIVPFVTGWSLMIFLGPLFSGIFLFLYLDNIKLSRWASLLGAIAFSFSGFFVSWMEWGTITHVALWLPLILLSMDKIVSGIKYHVLSIKNRKAFVWSSVYLFSLLSSFFAGHLQIFFYLATFSFCYFLLRWWQSSRAIRVLSLYLILNTLFLILSSLQWIPTLQFILLSSRNIDRIGIDNPGWFIPWQHLIQFVAPDFFGNPTTLNYWGVWNYGEFVGYIGIAPFIFAITGIFSRYDKKTLFFGTAFFISLILSLPTFISQIPFLLHIPFIETSQPTRLLFLADFSLAVLAALGFDYYLKNKKKIFSPLIFMALIFAVLWSFILLGFGLDLTNLSVAKSNLIFPSLIFLGLVILLSVGSIFSKLSLKSQKITYIAIILLLTFDLLRFAWKFTPFTQKAYLFPSTSTISFLQKNVGEFRIMSTDSSILPPNFSAIYRLKSVDGYDPLYLQRYGELIAASERGEPNISTPFGFNRILTPRNFESKIIDLLGVRYILSLSDLSSQKLKRVFQEGQTRIYKNMAVLPRAFFVKEIKTARDKNEVIEMLFSKDFDVTKVAFIEENDSLGVLAKPHPRWTVGEVKIVDYSENKVIIETQNSGDGFLLLTDSFYPTWHAKIDGVETKIYRTDYNFRGVIIPAGKHTVEFYNSLF